MLHLSIRETYPALKTIEIKLKSPLLREPISNNQDRNWSLLLQKIFLYKNRRK